ncbi:MAG: ankyrin repeat-containing domain protein [Benjaminiella poitrasii]|nr:MAG: ankyrin repeat-containing domain protein [Benjaminiella poitrasii]
MPSVLARTFALLNNNSKSNAKDTFLHENESRTSLTESIGINILPIDSHVRPQHHHYALKQQKVLQQALPQTLPPPLPSRHQQRRPKPSLTIATSSLLNPPTTATTTTITASTTLTIWKAAEQGNLKAIQDHIHTSKLGTATLLNLRDPETDCTLLHLAIASPYYTHRPADLYQMLLFLLRHGADATLNNVYNVQSIHMVAHYHHHGSTATTHDLMSLLLDHGANPNARDGDGWTPLHYVARFAEDRTGLMTLLLERGADSNVTDAHGKTPLFGLLANADDQVAVRMLLQRGTDVAQRGEFLDSARRVSRYGTVLLQATRYGRLDSLSFLVSNPEVLRRLRRVVGREELAYAITLATDALARGEAERRKGERMLVLLRAFEDRLLKDEGSLLSQEESGDHGSQGGVRQKPSTSQRLFRSVSRLVKRSKSHEASHTRQSSSLVICTDFESER